MTTPGKRPRATAGRSQDAYDQFAAVVELPLTILALLWLPVLVLPLVMKLPATVAEAFTATDYFVWAAFVLEYLVKLWLVPARWHFVTHHLLDLAVIALPMLRPLRAVRLFRILTLGRVAVVLVNALGRTRQLLTHRGLHFVLLAVAVIVFACSGLVLMFERQAPGSNIHGFADALWWSITTVTTVGYGDRYPTSAAGRGVAVVLMLVGIGLIGVLTATVASYFVGQEAEDDLAALAARLDRIEELLQALADGPNDSTSGQDPSASAL